MTRRRLLALSVLLISAIAFAPRAATLTAAQWPSAAKAAAPEYGPPNGTLVIAGGSTEGLILPIYDKFIELGGGVDGKFVIVPTAMGNFDGTGAGACVCGVAGHQLLAEPRPQEREDAAHPRSEDRRHGGVCEGPVGRDRRVVHRRAPPPHRRLLCRDAHLQGIPQGARARRGHRRQLGGRDDSGRLPRARGYAAEHTS